MSDDEHPDCLPGWCVFPPSDPRHRDHPASAAIGEQYAAGVSDPADRRSVRAVILSTGATVRGQWRELLREHTEILDEEGMPDGPEEVTVPEFGRVLAESGVLPRTAWPASMGVEEFVLGVLGPPPPLPPPLG